MMTASAGHAASLKMAKEEIDGLTARFEGKVVMVNGAGNRKWCGGLHVRLIEGARRCLDGRREAKIAEVGQGMAERPLFCCSRLKFSM